MQTKNAIKKLEKHYKQKVKKNKVGQYWIETGKDIIEFNDQEGEAIIIRVWDKNDHDDAMADYSTGVSVDNISQAIKIAE